MSCSLDNCSEDYCLSIPKNCSGNCDAAVVFTSNNASLVNLFGSISSTNYVAVGFSEDSSMGDDLVVSCALDAQGRPKVQFSFNEGYQGSPILKAQFPVTNVSFESVNEGHGCCSFILPTFFNISEKGHVFNLTSPSYVFLLAMGVLSNDNLAKHSQKTLSSQAGFNHVTTTPSTSRLGVQVHGVGMTVAWMVVAWAAAELPG